MRPPYINYTILSGLAYYEGENINGLWAYNTSHFKNNELGGSGTQKRPKSATVFMIEVIVGKKLGWLDQQLVDSYHICTFLLLQ